MQAHPAQAHPVTGALRAVEAFLLRGGQQSARRNAWTAVLDDRRRARDRHEAQDVLDTLTPSPVRPAAGAVGAARTLGGGER